MACTLFAEYLRMVNGSDPCRGRVEIFRNGQWKRVCSADWGMDEASLVCQELRCGPPVAQTDVLLFGAAQGLGGIKTNCEGNKSSLSMCHLQDLQESCVDATVVCSSKSNLNLM